MKKIISIMLILVLVIYVNPNCVLAANNIDSLKYTLSNLSVLKTGLQQLDVIVDIFNSNSNETEKADLHFALYDNSNRLIRILPQKNIDTPSFYAISKSQEFENIDVLSVKSVKVFLFKSGTLEPLAVNAEYSGVIKEAIVFVTEGDSFTPVIQNAENAQITWIFDDGTISTINAPVKNYGSNATRKNTLVVEPWSAVTRINIGYDAGDGGTNTIEFVPDQKVSSVQNMRIVAPYLKEWCSSYNQLTSLDFSNFTKIQTIECFWSRSLQHVNLSNTSELKRACFEDCDLTELDLSQSPKLEDLRGAVNNYSAINFGSVGTNTWHICVRDNPQMTNQNLFQDMSQFPNINELFIWNDNQSGSIHIPSTSKSYAVSLLASGNHYTSLDLSGALHNGLYSANVDFTYNNLNYVDITGCVQITSLNLQNNQLSISEADKILATLDELGRNRDNVNYAQLSVDISGGGNQQPSADGLASAIRLSKKGWTVTATGWTLTPAPFDETGEVRIDFSTVGNLTNMICTFVGSTTATWHWSDGTTSNAVSGVATEKSSLGQGIHSNYLVVSNSSAIERFGAANGGQGNLVSISGLENCPRLNTLLAFQEGNLTTIGRTNTSKIKEFHLRNTNLNADEMDKIFEDIVASKVYGGNIWCDNLGTSASDANIAILILRGWTIDSLVVNPSPTPTPSSESTPSPMPTPIPIEETGEVRIDFSTVGDLTSMRCDFVGVTTATWHWSDGTTSDAVSGANMEKIGLGQGIHNNYLVISNSSAIERFGAGNTGQGNLVTISGLENCPRLAVLFAYMEWNLTTIGRTSTSKIREYHLANTNLNSDEMDNIISDSVASGVYGGTLWCNNLGSSSSDANKIILQSRGWTIN